MSPGGAKARERSLGALGRGVFDVLVIGGGIVGARVAYEAARNGFGTGLVDAGDFGGATSACSGKLVHGGLRYLRRGDLRLARRAQLERHALSARVAPHLVRPLPFLLAPDGEGPPSAALAAGLLGYWALGGLRGSAPRLVTAERARSLVPSLTTGGPHALFCEAHTDDARLTLATV